MFLNSDIGGNGEDGLQELLSDDNAIALYDSNGTALNLLYPPIPNHPQGHLYETPVPGGVFIETTGKLIVVNGPDLTIDIEGTPTLFHFFLIVYDSAHLANSVASLQANYDDTPAGFGTNDYPISIF